MLIAPHTSAVYRCIWSHWQFTLYRVDNVQLHYEPCSMRSSIHDASLSDSGTPALFFSRKPPHIVWGLVANRQEVTFIADDCLIPHLKIPAGVRCRPTASGH